MVKWEYKIVEYGDQSHLVCGDMNEEGSEGWEVIDISRAANGYYVNEIVYKRPIEEEPLYEIIVEPDKRLIMEEMQDEMEEATEAGRRFLNEKR